MSDGERNRAVAERDFAAAAVKTNYDLLQRAEAERDAAFRTSEDAVDKAGRAMIERDRYKAKLVEIRDMPWWRSPDAPKMAGDALATEAPVAERALEGEDNA